MLCWCRNLTICQKREDLKKLQPPYVVLASSNALDTSFAQELFLEMAGNPKHLILFTYRSPRGTLAHQLMAQPPPSHVEFKQSKNVALEGAELEKYFEEKRIEKEQEILEKKKEMDEDSDDDDDAVMAAAASAASAASGAGSGSGGAAGSGGSGGASNDGDISMTGGSTKVAQKNIKLSAAFPMYPYVEKKRAFDLYGEIINPDDYKKETISTSCN